jgi:hypothetical protein
VDLVHCRVKLSNEPAAQRVGEQRIAQQSKPPQINALITFMKFPLYRNGILDLANSSLDLNGSNYIPYRLARHQFQIPYGPYVPVTAFAQRRVAPPFKGQELFWGREFDAKVSQPLAHLEIVIP